jgi:hypothetical protein
MELFSQKSPRQAQGRFITTQKGWVDGKRDQILRTEGKPLFREGGDASGTSGTSSETSAPAANGASTDSDENKTLATED